MKGVPLVLLSLCFLNAYQTTNPTRARPATAPTAIAAIFPVESLSEPPSELGAVLPVEHALVHELIGPAVSDLDMVVLIVVAGTKDDAVLVTLDNAAAPGLFSVHRVPSPSPALSVSFNVSASMSRKKSGPV
ncbi:uncharacterized protein M421DRAFT_92160 [Didymella exigua CBS 183.55]|uniref:Secreted protein n=1 Tax=Didymella exigua CBS 183.55 TaxID=1150837 RepID=A0A6A5RRY4_9PLEO|nr:uncharacterized protein M421DRAFT_92160 [Didymella exigua CBS 183.55]KAF1929056.1 hypothetical protein M421DRAFT_92160 [Didymella exigua CBS 183.55]